MRLITVGNFMRMLVRPIVTISLVAAVIYAALTKNMEGAKELGLFTATAITFWFSDRQNTPAKEGDK